MVSDTLEKEIIEHSKAINSNYPSHIAYSIISLATDIDAITYRHYKHLSEQPGVARNILIFAGGGHPVETLKQYSATIIESWNQFDSCYKDDFDPDIGDTRRDNISGHLYDLQEYIPKLMKYLPRAIAATGPKLSAQIFSVLDIFEENRGEKLLRGTAWAYEISFLSALSKVTEELCVTGESPTNPLAELGVILNEALSAAKGNVKFTDAFFTALGDGRETQHRLTFQIGDKNILMNDPNDAQGMETLIRTVFYNSGYKPK